MMIYNPELIYRPQIVYPSLEIKSQVTYNDVEAWLRLDHEIADKLNCEIELRATILLDLKRGFRQWS